MLDAHNSMRWYAKEQPLPFDTKAIAGFFYLDGDAVSSANGKGWTRSHKCPQILFPSGIACEVWGTSVTALFVNLWGTLDVPYFADRDTVLEHLLLAISPSDFISYVVYGIAGDQIFIKGAKMDEQLLLTYNDRFRLLENIQSQ